jgi:hypothetical protein
MAHPSREKRLLRTACQLGCDWGSASFSSHYILAATAFKAPQITKVIQRPAEQARDAGSGQEMMPGWTRSPATSVVGAG